MFCKSYQIRVVSPKSKRPRCKPSSTIGMRNMFAMQSSCKALQNSEWRTWATTTTKYVVAWHRRLWNMSGTPRVARWCTFRWMYFHMDLGNNDHKTRRCLVFCWNMAAIRSAPRGSLGDVLSLDFPKVGNLLLGKPPRLNWRLLCALLSLFVAS